ncbi:hypothetical protein NQ318_022858 [Aromia moschata]|uniref:Ig-like domain-containing protein n=1 Tax=Aromia moschata TaxID=1265417 RepID=A0AAV8Y2Z8_9CUCU|nr:hypothetical protein NQ318_022858 [Aromia moschata]
MEIKVPEAVRLGDSVTLACDYDLESVALYTIKWYRYDEEFYRYVPKESPPSKVFAMAHLNVDNFSHSHLDYVKVMTAPKLAIRPEREYMAKPRGQNYLLPSGHMLAFSRRKYMLS